MQFTQTPGYHRPGLFQEALGGLGTLLRRVSGFQGPFSGSPRVSEDLRSCGAQGVLRAFQGVSWRFLEHHAASGVSGT